MSVKTKATWLCARPSVYLMFALLLKSYSSVCGDILTDRIIETSKDENTTEPVVITPQGTVQGINMLTHYNRTIFGFLGIPYAQPPLGDLRFRSPLPPEPWNGTLDASKETLACCQTNLNGEPKGTEDCLYHNIFTPQLPKNDNSTLLPVMVFIIGGGYKGENNSLVMFNPDFLLEKDVVLIVPNYRVGLMGFLTTGDESSPGNYGLKDIVRVLEWVQEYVSYYGGDRNRVTLFGGSSGAMSVHVLALSKLTHGLFHNYITQSGTALGETVNKPRKFSVGQTLKVAKYFGCPTNHSTLLVDCLRTIDATDLMDTDKLFYMWRKLPTVIWYPTYEPDIEGALLTDSPGRLFSAGNIRDLPWMATMTPGEGLISSVVWWYEDPDMFEEVLTDIDYVLPIIMEYGTKFEDPTPYTNALKAYYLNDLNANRTLLLKNITQLIGDGLFAYATYKAVKQHSTIAKSPNYFGLFNYRGVFGNTFDSSGGSTEYSDLIAHGDEILYLFETHSFKYGPPGAKRTHNDWIMVDRIVDLWTSFATNSTPTMTVSADTAIWEPYNSKNNYFRIGNGSEISFGMEYDLYKERMRFWDELTTRFIGSVLEFQNSTINTISLGNFKNSTANTTRSEECQKSIACAIHGTLSLFSLICFVTTFYHVYLFH